MRGPLRASGPPNARWKCTQCGGEFRWDSDRDKLDAHAARSLTFGHLVFTQVPSSRYRRANIYPASRHRG